MAGGGFIDTRVANMSATMWRSIYISHTPRPIRFFSPREMEIPLIILFRSNQADCIIMKYVSRSFEEKKRRNLWSGHEEGIH